MFDILQDLHNSFILVLLQLYGRLQYNKRGVYFIVWAALLKKKQKCTRKLQI